MLVGAGLALLARATTPGSYWVQVFPAVVLFGVGLAVTVAPLTSTAMGAAPAEHSGIASAVNNTVARAAGLFAVACCPLWPASAGPPASCRPNWPTGFRTAVFIAGATCAAGGLVAVLTIRNPVGTAPAQPQPRVTRSTARCGGPPLRGPRPPAGSPSRRLTRRTGAPPPADVRPAARAAKVGACHAPHAAPAPAVAPEVFAPAALGPLTLRNRIIKAATFEGVMPGGTVSDALVEFHRRVAAGGAAMSTVAYLAVSPEGRTDRHCLLLNEDNVAGPAPADRRHPRRGRGGGGPDRPRRARRQRALQPGPRPLALRRLHARWARACAPSTPPASSASPRTTGAPPRAPWRRASTASRCTSGTTTSSARS